MLRSRLSHPPFPSRLHARPPPPLSLVPPTLYRGMIQQVPRAAVSALRSLGADSDCFATSETSESGADLICVYDLGAGIGAHGMAPVTVYKV